MKAIKWISQGGNEYELRARCSFFLFNKEWENGEGIKIIIDREPRADALLEVYKNGKPIGRTNGISEWQTMPILYSADQLVWTKDWTLKDCRKAWGVDEPLTKEQADKLDTFFNDLMNSEKPKEVLSYEKKQKLERAINLLPKAKELVEKAKEQDRLYTRAERAYLITKEEYDEALEIIKLAEENKE